jgi:hypothetical protein
MTFLKSFHSLTHPVFQEYLYVTGGYYIIFEGVNKRVKVVHSAT